MVDTQQYKTYSSYYYHLDFHIFQYKSFLKRKHVWHIHNIDIHIIPRSIICLIKINISKCMVLGSNFQDIICDRIWENEPFRAEYQSLFFSFRLKYGNLPTGCKLNGSSRHYHSLDIELQSLEAIIRLNWERAFCLRIDIKLKSEFSKAELCVKEVSTRCETSHNAGGKVAASNKLIKTFCQKYTPVQFFEYSIIALKRLFSQILSHIIIIFSLYFSQSPMQRGYRTFLEQQITSV